MILLDADVAIDLLRRHPPALDWLQTQFGDDWFIPGYAAMEIIHGCNNARELNETSAFLRQYQIVWPSALTCQRAISVFGRSRLSAGVGILDTLNAYTSIELNTPIHTSNVKHYRPIPEVRTIQPYPR